MQEGHQVKPVAKVIAIGFMLPEARDIMDYALEQYEEHKKQVQEMTGGEFPKEPVYSFAYWLFRWSGLIQYELPDEEAKPQAAAQVREAALLEAIKLICTHCDTGQLPLDLNSLGYFHRYSGGITYCDANPLHVLLARESEAKSE